MADILQSSVAVTFGKKDRDGSLVWEEDNTRNSLLDSEVYVRLYPADPEVLIVNAGTIKSKGRDEAKVKDYVVFSGETEQQLKYPVAYGVTIIRLGQTYDLDGLPLVVTYSYNIAKNSIITDKPCYGIVEVQYTAPYHLYLYTFTGKPCELKYVDENWIYLGGYTPAFLVAMNPADAAVDTMQLTPEECGNNFRSSISDKTSGPVGIVLEIHKDFPTRITGSSTVDGIEVGCKVRQIPDVAAEIDMSSGTHKQDKFLISSDEADRDSNIYLTNNYEPSYTEVIKDLVTFNVGYSAKLKYQPSGNITVIPTGPFLDTWGNTVLPVFAKPGDRILEVEWINENTYTNPVERVVQEDEIVALTTGNKTIDVYGAAAVDYAIRFKVFDIKFQTTNPLRSEDGWDSIHMIARYLGQTAYLSIPAPSIKEK